MTTHPTFIRLLFLILVSLLITASGFAANKKPQNTVILLDLSDRIIQPGQLSKDTAILLTQFRLFEKKAMQQLIMTCRNRFSVVIAPQESNSLKTNESQNLLTLDLSSYAAAERLKALRNFSQAFPHAIKNLYAEASKYNKNKSYSGSDLWRYFNEQLAFDLKNRFDNKLIVLTDGYFDFENSENKMRIKNRSTTTYFLSELKGPFWKETAIKKNYGLLKVKNKFPGLETYVVGFSPKKQDQLEIDKLVYFWEEWLKEMSVKSINCMPSTTPEKTINALRNAPP